MAAGAAFLALAGGLAPAAGGKGNTPEWPEGFALVPQDAIAVLSMRQGERLIEKAGPSSGLFLQRLARWLGAEKEEISRAFLEGPFTAALFPSEEGSPSLLLVFPGGRKAPENLLSLLGKGPGAYRPAGRIGGVEVGSYTLPPPVGMRLFALWRGNTFLAATSKGLLSRALEAEASPATKSLQSDVALARLFRSGAYKGDGRVFVSFKKGIFKGGPAFLASLGEEKAWVTWTSCVEGKGVVTRLRLEWPEPRAGWGALAGEKSCPVHLEKALPGPEDLVVTAGFLLPEAPKGKTNWNTPLLPWLERAAPIPWRRLMPGLSGDFSFRLQAGSGGPVSWAALMDLTNPSRIDRVLRAPGKAWKNEGESTVSGYTVTTLKDSVGKSFSWAMAADRLLLGNAPALVEKALAPAGEEGKSAPQRTQGRASAVFLKAHGKVDALASILPPFFRSFLEGCGGPFTLEGFCDPAGVGFTFFNTGSPPGFHLLKSLRFPNAGPEGGLARKEEGKATSGTDWKSLTPKERYEALTALERAGDVSVYAEEVEALLEDPDPAVAARAAYALGTQKVESSVPGLCKALRDCPHPVVRRYSAYALMRMPDPREESFLLQALKDEDPMTRGYAATALERLRSTKAAVPLARALLAHPKAPKETRLRLLSALAELGSPKEVPKVLLAAGPKADVDLLRAQVYALQKLTPQLPRSEEEALLTQILDLPSSYVRGYAVDRLGEIGGPEVVNDLERRLPMEGPQFRKRIEAALAVVKTRNGPGLAFKKVVDAASKKMTQAREKLAEAFGEVKTWPAWKKGVIASVPLVLAGFLFLLWRWLKARAAMRAHMKLVTLVSSSEEDDSFLAGMEEDIDPPVDQDVSWEDETAGTVPGEEESRDSETEEEEPAPEPGEEPAQLLLDDQEEVDEMIPLEGEDDAFLEKSGPG